MSSVSEPLTTDFDFFVVRIHFCENFMFLVSDTLWRLLVKLSGGQHSVFAMWAKCVCTTRTSITCNIVTKCVCRVWLYLHVCQCSVVTNFELFVDNVQICSVKVIFLTETSESVLCFDVYVL